MLKDPLGNRVELPPSIVRGQIFRRHPELKGKLQEIKETMINPDIVAKSKKDAVILLYFRKINDVLYLNGSRQPEKGLNALTNKFLRL